MRLSKSVLKAQRDYDNSIAFAREEAFKEAYVEGFEKGRHEVKKDTAVKLMEMKMPIESIIEITGFTAKEIEKLWNYFESAINAKWNHDNSISFASEQASEERIRNIATKLKEMGMPVDNITEITGLTAKEIERL